MAIVAHTPYTGQTDCSRTNTYISDGHGAPVTRVNRYVSDGHGKTTLIGSHNCPPDPILATEYMETLRLNYERQHPVGEARRKSCVTHEQIYLSPTEEDNVPAEERMEMMRELIERTVLKDFASIYVPHDNTPDKHGHISVCPYSIPDENGKTHKLCLNNRLLNDLRREMDYICVERGYSIVENPELWGDKSYRDWFFKIRDAGIVKIHPPKEQDMATFKKNRKRSRSYAASKQSHALKQEKQAALYKQMTRGYSRENAELFYSPPNLYAPQNPEYLIHIKKHNKNGDECSEMELASFSLFVWAYQASKQLKQRKIPGSIGLQKRMDALASKAFAAKNLIQSLDIRTHAELISHIKECGSDISELKQDIARQDTILNRMAAIMDAIDRWENQRDSDAYSWLREHHCSTDSEITDAKKRHARAMARKHSNESLLDERKAEYRHLKEAESILHPARNEKEWHEYLGTAFGKEVEKKLGLVSSESLNRHMYQMGKIIGLSSEEIHQFIARAKKVAAETDELQWLTFMQTTYDTNDHIIISRAYDNIRHSYEDIRELRKLARSVPIIGPFSFLLSLAIGIYAGIQIDIKEQEIEELKWEATTQKEYAKETRRMKQQALHSAKSDYESEIINASEAEILASRIRFYEKAAQITGRFDILSEIDDMRRAGDLDSIIDAVIHRRLRSEFQDAPPHLDFQR